MLQPFLPLPAFRHFAGLQLKKGGVVVVMHKVAELMDDYVLDATLRGFHQLNVQNDLSFRCATAPALVHPFDNHGGRFHSILFEPAYPLFRYFPEFQLCTRLVPVQNQLFCPGLLLFSFHDQY